MNETTIAGCALAVSLLTAASHLLHSWLDGRMRADLADMRLDLLKAIDENFVRQSVCVVEREACRDRYKQLHERVNEIAAQQ